MNPALVIGALIVSVLLLVGLLNILKVAFKTALLVALVIFILQVLTGVGPEQVWDQVAKMIGSLGGWLLRTIRKDNGDSTETEAAIAWFLHTYLPGLM